MPLTKKQERFAREYVVDQNAAQAAIRAGFAEGRAKQTGHDMLAKPDVAQLVEKLDAGKRDDLGIEARDALAEVQELLRDAKEKQPRIWKGEIFLTEEQIQEPGAIGLSLGDF